MQRAWARRFPWGAALCGIPVIGGANGGPIPTDLFNMPTLGQFLPVALAVGVFAAAGVWMFKRWGGQAGVPAPTEEDDRMVVAATASERLWSEFDAAAAADGQSTPVAADGSDTDRDPTPVVS